MIVTLALFTLLVNLGQWQLSRAAEKSQQEQQLLNNEQRAPVPLPQLLQQLPTPVLEHQQPLPSAFVGRQVQLIAHPLISRPFSPINQQDEQDNDVQQSIYLLDNQTVAGQVGYLGYQLMQVQLTDHPSKPETMQALSMPNSALMFVELGFIAAPKSRQQLPQFEAFTEQVTLQGRVYQKLRNPISEQLWLEDGAPKRIQNLNLAQLAQEFATQESLPLLPILLQPKQQPQPLVQPWQPLSMLSSKHYGYALQWFSLALALIVLTSYFVYRHFLNRH